MPSIPFRLTLRTQIMLLIAIVVCTSMIFASAVFSMLFSDKMHKQIGDQAMSVAKLTAMDERIAQAFATAAPSDIIQPIAEAIRLHTGASYVVIGNRDGIRYSHQKTEHIGKVMGSSNEPVFARGESIIYEGTGISGQAIKAKTPIRNSNGDIIGVSSVGYLFHDIDETIMTYRRHIVYFTAIILAAGLLAGYAIARRVKRLIFNLEPEQIAFLFQEKAATLDSIREAIVAVDLQGNIVSMNRRARELLQGSEWNVGEQLQLPHLHEALQTVARTGVELSHQRIFIQDQLYAMQAAPIQLNHTVRGAVFTLQTESEAEQLVEQFTKMKAATDHIRAQNHEFLNRLNTIYGLITLEQYDQALHLISNEVKERQDTIAFLMNSVTEPLLAACLLGKLNRAKELKVTLDIDPDSSLTQLHPQTDAKALVTILGNIIDNGMEAAQEQNGTQGIVRVSFTDLGADIVFDIEDNGTGIKVQDEQYLFIDGYTTKKGENRGLGLALVKHALSIIGGQLYMDHSHLGGARVTVVIPKITDDT
ncbi:ATP-binding protein [Paenibacillus sp. 481]|uniref:ATP-binding protein n=1 Tax=Paenibacillus sp. 481 TaxID=2835869 RepID=UPI001E5DA8F5|nr:sensor histidine kinase [Paenibacillus sp. 481]UHA75089.1 sensor histidine kinase [Paenibacillus sp. 481]